MWPGFGENMRVLEWIVKRVNGQANATESVFGYSPRYEDLRWKGLSMSEESFNDLMSVNVDMALSDVKAQSDYFKTLRKQKRLPQDFEAELLLLQKRLERRK